MDVVSMTPSATPITSSVGYSCVLRNLWTAQRHPVGYPSGAAHWSPPVLVAHSDGYSVWDNGAMATEGMENLAELGATRTLMDEINNAGASTGSPVRGVNQFADSQTIPSITASPDHYLISVATMVAPSPDWFSGFHDFDARDMGAGTWLSEFTLETYPWDAGTETGSSFSLSNPAQNPQQPISQHTLSTFPNNGDILPMARWECSLVNDGDTSEACDFLCASVAALMALIPCL